MTRTINATATTAKPKAINKLVLAKENQTEQEFLTYTDMVDNQLSDNLIESEPHTTTKSFILPESQLTRVTKRHRANRAYFNH